MGVGLGGLALVLAFQKKQTGAAQRTMLALMALGVGGLVLLGGFAAFLLGIQRMTQALAAVDPSMKARIEELGRHEALSCVWIGVGLWVPITVLAGAALGVGAAAQKAKAG
jgi:hypothetical protein